MSNQLVSSLTVNELKELVASIIDNRIDNLVKSLSASYASDYFINKQRESLGDFRLKPELIATSSQALQIRQLQDNPWLEIAGVHQDNPLFAEVSNSIEADHHDIPQEELS
ncbi:MAG: hypothetical protein DCE90_18675 [Pseudanabaena sp.]|nr:MAG: hypothetical protein DCE90_18675 [Pseudanabaena sp.]